MKLYWWQNGLHLEPESKKEFDALGVLMKELHFLNIDQDFVACPVNGDLADEQSVVDVNVVHENLADIH
jgi:hypothetical protein